ncbi:MAG: Maf family protein [Desulfobacterales bacterium]|nr:Maf family protein [Desulfobacterales bacterium]
MNQINHEKIILASQSPRRKELLARAGIKFDIVVADIDEEAVPYKGDPGRHAATLSGLKAEAVADNHPGAWTLGADTIVVTDNLILGKPKDRDDAVKMLGSLSNRAHSVFTGFTLTNPGKEICISESVETRVVFKQLSAKEIRWYSATGEPYDKAGAYGIQGIGAFMVKEICGSYTNVVGLPVCEIIETLTRVGVVEF